MNRGTTWVWMRVYAGIMVIASMGEVRILVGKRYFLSHKNKCYHRKVSIHEFFC